MEDNESGHVIRLHAAWIREERGADGTATATARVALPDTSAVHGGTTHLRYTRKFNRPTGLGPGQSIRFQSELLALASQIQFNGMLLPLPNQQESLDLTGTLQAHNELMIEVPMDARIRLAHASAKLILG